MSVTFTAASRTFSVEFNADVIRSLPAAEELSVNMSNSNAAHVCDALGIDLAEWGWCGDGMERGICREFTLARAAGRLAARF